MVFPTERHFSIFLANRMSDALEGINQRLPTPNENETYAKEDFQYIQSQLDVYFTVLSECTKEMSSHSRSLALLTNFVNVQILNICRKSLKTMQAITETPTNEIKIEEKPLIIDNSKDEKIEQLQTQLRILQKEFDKNKEDLDRQNYETFALKSQVSQNEKKINSLLKVNQSLRDMMTESKHKLFTEKQQNSKPNSNISIASVPKDVFTIWDEVSQFSQFILQGNLMKLDVNKIFPPNPTKSSILPPNFTFQKEQTEFKEGIYYSNFFTDIKKQFGTIEPNAIYKTLNIKFNEFIGNIFEVYKTKLIEQEKKEKEFVNKIFNDLESSTKSIVDHSAWIRTLLSSDCLAIPSQKDQSYDFYSAFDKIASNTSKLMTNVIKPRFASEIIMNTFSEEEIIQFLSNILKLSKNDLFADFVRKFIIIELPFHSFLFLCDFWNSLKKNQAQDQKEKLQVLLKFFKKSGWLNNSNRNEMEKNYCTNDGSLAAFAVALYTELIDVIEKSIVLESNDLKKEIVRLFNLDSQQANNCWQLLIAISSDGKNPTKKEMAVFSFMNQNYHGNELSEFNSEKSSICEYINIFGKSTKKGKKSKGKKEKIEKSNLQTIKNDSHDEIVANSENEN